MRVNNISLLKTIAISLVVMIHFGPLQYSYEGTKLNYNMFLVYRSLLSIGVPLFLIISGYLTIEKDYSIKKCLRRVSHLLFLIIAFKIIYAYSFNVGFKSFSDLVYALTSTIAKGYRVNHMWYLYALIAIYLMYPIISYCYKDKKIYTYIVIIVVSSAFILNPVCLLFKETLGYDLQLIEATLPLQSHYLFAIAYFMVGGWLRKAELPLFKKLGITPLLISFVLLISLQALYAQVLSNYTNTLFDPMYDGYSIVTCLFSSIIVFTIFKDKVKRIDSKFIKKVSCYTFGIYLIHWPLAYYIKPIIFDLVNINIYIENFIASIIVLLISLLLNIKYLKNLITF
ncbi:MAG: acyltransferase [Erysipelotrichales bacterium]